MKTIAFSVLFLCSAAVALAQESIWYGSFTIPPNSNLHAVGNPNLPRTDTVAVKFASKLPCASPAVQAHLTELDIGSPDNDTRITVYVGATSDDGFNVIVGTWWTNTITSYTGDYLAWCPASGSGPTSLTEDAIKAKISELARETAEKHSKTKAKEKAKTP